MRPLWHRINHAVSVHASWLCFHCCSRRGRHMLSISAFSKAGGLIRYLRLRGVTPAVLLVRTSLLGTQVDGQLSVSQAAPCKGKVDSLASEEQGVKSPTVKED